MVTTMPTNMADVAKRPGGTRQAAADRDMRQAKRQTVALTPAEVKCTDSQLVGLSGPDAAPPFTAKETEPIATLSASQEAA
jgi:hypothetical protein